MSVNIPRSEIVTRSKSKSLPSQPLQGLHRSNDSEDTRSQCSNASLLSTTSSAARIQARVRIETSKQALAMDQEIREREAELSRLSVERARERLAEEQERARLADLKAADRQKEIERLTAERQLEIERLTRERELDIMAEERERERLAQERQHENDKLEAEKPRELSFLNAKKAVVLAETEAKVVEDIIQEEQLLSTMDRPTMVTNENNNANVHRTFEWVNSHGSISMYPENETTSKQVVTPSQANENSTTCAMKTLEVNSFLRPASLHCSKADSSSVSPQLPDIPTNHESSQPDTTISLAHLLAKQCLPRCEPDVYDGDVTLFHPWRAGFKVMISNANINPTEELAYLKRFTKGAARSVVDSFSRRLYTHPGDAIKDVWAALDRRFGNTAAITNAHMELLEQAAYFGEEDHTRLQSFSDICDDVNSQLLHLPGLACLNYPRVLQPIINKLPTSIRHKWEKVVAEHAEENNDAYPNFHRFTKFISQQARLKNHPNLHIRQEVPPDIHQSLECTPRPSRMLSAYDDARILKSTSTNEPSQRESKTKRPCPIHNNLTHDVFHCKSFEEKSHTEKSDILFNAMMCFRCLTGEHKARDCRERIKCDKCGSNRHHKLMHQDPPQDRRREVSSACTDVCGGEVGGLSCSKIILVDVYATTQPLSVRRVYALLDDQSNSSLISPELIDDLRLQGKEEKYYLTTCTSDRSVRYGRRIHDMVVIATDGNVINLPSLLECDNIPSDKSEIPTPEIASQFPHLHDIASEIRPFDKKAAIHLLIGRDAPEIMKVRSFKNGPPGAPWAHRHNIGWTISGQVCLDRIDGPVHVKAHRTHVNPGDLVYEVSACCNQLTVSEPESDYNDIFAVNSNDETIAMSEEDRRFLRIMDAGFHKNQDGYCEMPLPFRNETVRSPDNREQILRRLLNLKKTLTRKPEMKKDYIAFMKNVFDRGHAEVVGNETSPTSDTSSQRWYLPHFGVYNPKKPGKIRVVFDASAEFQGVSLNSLLLTGPDELNSLLGVLVRFRKENVGVVCDVEQMFHSFYVNPEHREFLRFFWYKDHDLSNEIIECRMRVHIFGNSSSPAVATYGLRRTADESGEDFGQDTKNFVHRDFYVDDGITSCDTAESAIRLIKSSMAMLKTTNLHLHKVASNDPSVMHSVAEEDRANDIRAVNLQHDPLPTIRTLGVTWNLEDDVFSFQVSLPEKPYTRRGVLSVVNSVYDPIGFAAPVTLQGKLLLQQLTVLGRKESASPLNWDDPLPPDMANQWQQYRNGLTDLEDVRIPRCYHTKTFGEIKRMEIHAFCDASKAAIGVAVYTRMVNVSGQINVALVYGQAKVAPLHHTTIPRLELCAAVMATEAVTKIVSEIDQNIDDVVFYTDSQIVLGYIRNESRRFYVYVANRVQKIRNASEPSQWRHVATEDNPADLASRGVPAKNLKSTMWLSGPQFLHAELHGFEDVPASIEVQESDPETIPHARVNATRTAPPVVLGSERFQRFSKWSVLKRAVACLIVRVKMLKRNDSSDGNLADKDEPIRRPTVVELRQAEDVIIKSAQADSFKEEIKRLNNPRTHREYPQRDIKKLSHFEKLTPFVDVNGIVRVGGRIEHAVLPFEEKHPVILPKNNHITTLILRDCHERVHHQGRTTTQGALRRAGYWVIGIQSLTSQLISSCVTCRRIRGSIAIQQMADLPPDRLEPCAPFTHVGFDVFGPWLITTRKLRGGALESKRWCVVFTCLVSRAIHLEVIESMDTSAFICALRRFIGIRGQVNTLRCDRGSNFIGAKNEIDQQLMQMNQTSINKYLTDHNCEWIFNPPHASHFGGVWERQILTIRRVLNSMFYSLGSSQLTHELLVTFMAEVCGIVNSRPITTITTDIDEPQPLTPMMLLTMKTRPFTPIPGSYERQDLYGRRRWKRIQYLADQFWCRWRKEYLQTLQTRSKWSEEERDMRVDDVVVVKSEDSPQYQWPLGRVTGVVPGRDGKIRAVTVTFWRNGLRSTLTRPISQIVLIVPNDTP